MWRGICRGIASSCLILAGIGTAMGQYGPTAITTNPPGQPPDGQWGSGWNPQTDCQAGAETSARDLLECLAAGLDPTVVCRDYFLNPLGAPGEYEIVHLDATNPDCPMAEQDRSEYIVTLVGMPPIGFEVKRRVATPVGGLEPFRFFLRESSARYQWTQISVNRPGLEGRIVVPRQHPRGGEIQVTVNRQMVAVATRYGDPIEQAGIEIAKALRTAGFTAVLQGKFLIITPGQGQPAPINHLEFNSLDPWITESELHLAPPGDYPAELVEGDTPSDDEGLGETQGDDIHSFH